MKFFSMIVFTFLISSAFSVAMEFPTNSQKKRGRVVQELVDQTIARKREKKEQLIVAVKKIQEKKECPICLCNLAKKNQVTLPCHATHQFHINCLQQWREKSNVCPFGCPPVRAQGQDSLTKRCRLFLTPGMLMLEIAVLAHIGLNIGCSLGYIQCPATNSTFI